jgi:hypothetical protein
MNQEKLFRKMFKAIFALCFAMAFFNTIALTQEVIDTIFYTYCKCQESEGTVYRIVENKKSNSQKKKDKNLHPIEGQPECYFFLEDGNAKKNIRLLKRYLNGRDNKYYLLCNYINSNRIQTWYPLNQPIDISNCSSKKVSVNFQKYDKIKRFEIFSTKATVKLHKLELDANVLRQAKFTDLIVPQVKNKSKYWQILIIEPL